MPLSHAGVTEASQPGGGDRARYCSSIALIRSKRGRLLLAAARSSNCPRGGTFQTPRMRFSTVNLGLVPQ